MALAKRPHAKSACRALLLVLAGSAVAPVWSDVQFVPSIAASTIYVDNLNLTPPGVPTSSDLVGELDPGLHIRQQAPDLTSALDYNLQALWFHDHTNLDATHSTGRANESWTAVANLFFVDGWASYIQQTTDPTQPTNEGNLFSVGNIANRLSAYLAPTIRHDFGQITGLLRYAESTSLYSGVSSSESTLFQNSRTGIATAKLAADDADGPFAWSLDGRSSLTTFETAQPFRDDRASAEASVRVLQSLRLSGTAGAETNILTHSTSGGLDAGFWTVGFKWAPSANSVLEARGGHRFFGNAYSGRWTRVSRLLKFQISYVEEPTTDAESDSLVAFVPGEISVDTQAYFGVLRALSTYAPYLRKQLDASFDLTGELTQLALRVYDLRREYLQAPLLGTGDSTRGGELTLTRKLSVRDSLDLSARLSYVSELTGFVFRDHRYAIDYIHKLTETLDAKLEGVHLVRNGSAEYRVNIVRLTVRKKF